MSIRYFLGGILVVWAVTYMVTAPVVFETVEKSPVAKTFQPSPERYAF